MNDNQLEGVADALSKALAEFLKDKNLHTELLKFTLAAPEEKKQILGQETHKIGQTALTCYYNDYGQYVCIKSH